MPNNASLEPSSVLEFEAHLQTAQRRLDRLARSSSLSDGDVLASLREITEGTCELLSVARSSIWIYDSAQSAIRCLDLYVASERSHDAGTELLARDFPAYFAALRSESAISAADAHRDPRTTEFSVPYLRPLGIGAMLDAPIRVGGRMIGVLCNEHIGPERRWSVIEEFVASVLAEHAALAFLSSERRSAEEQLRLLLRDLEHGATGDASVSHDRP